MGLISLRRRWCCRSASSACCGNPSQPISQLNNEEEQLPLSGNHINADNDDESEEDDLSKNICSKVSSSSSSLSCGFPPILFFAVPGAIYFFNNNLTFILLSLMPAPTYVVLSNLKILTTGLFSFLFLNRILTTSQWVSLGILFLSTAVSQVDLEKGLSLSISIQAFLLMILFCSLSATASVFSEYVMKERFANESIHLQNMKLYMFGILFNGFTYVVTPPTSEAANDVSSSSFFSDMAPIHYMIIAAYASLGLVTSAIIKFSGSITKVYASSMSMFFAALVSWLFLNDQLTVLFFIGCFGCCIALHLYYRVPAVSPNTPVDREESYEKIMLEEEEEEEEEETQCGSTSSTSSEPRNMPSSSEIDSIKIVGRNGYISLDTHDDHDQRSS
ncbi:hypothetical protein BGZ80_008696 [Entomortierella chlamydospora]|uniref:Nucleotide-sugar transporter n=1 Tax=Entomortierella chlamydospora TaxID=101097 RepID=A0A9P6MYF3_9FUNG|nr:hypothetical protein BGZ79_006675 [Entomortierella chlamydospora]KAG0017013.1 hypothetical protein BGZ80_008696 [Entomortierella chlamydospora]